MMTTTTQQQQHFGSWLGVLQKLSGLRMGHGQCHGLAFFISSHFQKGRLYRFFNSNWDAGGVWWSLGGMSKGRLGNGVKGKWVSICYGTVS
jgi:hypothetical protein